MKRIYHIILIIILAVLSAACNEEQEQNRHCILVVHSYSNRAEEGKMFVDYMDKEFKRNKIAADVHHFYLNQLREPERYQDSIRMEMLIDSITILKPEVLLLNNNQALDMYLSEDSLNMSEEKIKQKEKIIQAQPTVFAGIRLPDTKKLSGYSNITGFEDKIDLQANCHIMMQLTGLVNPIIELDHFKYDSLIRTECYNQLEDTLRYINNGNFTVNNIESNTIKKHYPGIAVVSFISSAEPESNKNFASDNPLLSNGMEMYKRMIYLSKSLFHIQVKYDIYSNSLLDHNKNPQFTCIREQFNSPYYCRILGGYFSSMETQIEDQVRYAILIINGTEPKQLPIGTHSKDYYLDYNAMQEWSYNQLKYEDWSDQFNIINVPYEVKHPYIYWGRIGLWVVLAVIGILLIPYFYIRTNKRREKVVTAIEEHENIRRSLALKNNDMFFWKIMNKNVYIDEKFAKKWNLKSQMTMKEFFEIVHKDSMSSWKTLANYGNASGETKIRLQLSLSKGGEYDMWYEIRFNSTAENVELKYLIGIATPCGDLVKEEERMRRLQRDISESALKQSILSNMSHDIRTPLNAVSGFAQLITSDGMEFSEQELEEFNTSIHENSELMMMMIDNVMAQSQIDMGDIIMRPVPYSATTFIKSTYNTHTVLTPAHLELNMEIDKPDCKVMMDPGNTKQVINNFLSNAFKFTPKGSITIGWKYSDDKKYAIFYCKDTGIGIKKEAQAHLFDRFYKVSEQAVGTGLGLNISKSLIEQEEGEIGQDSEEGVGSTFWFKLKII